MAVERFGNYNTCCRLCLSDQLNSLKPIFDNADKSILVRRIQTYVGVQVTPNDKVSTMICTECKDKVNDWDNFRKECSRNQSKLQNWLSTWTSSQTNEVVQIKEEPVDRDDDEVMVINQNGVDEHIGIKSEPRSSQDEEDDVYDTAPILSPQTILDEHPFGRNQNASTSNQDKTKKDSTRLESSTNQSTTIADSEAELSESDMEKIHFAAGLRLKSKSLTSNQVLDVPITKIEEAYLERSHAMLTMLYTNRCACHNVYYPTVKRLFGHLRASFNWFPIFTCYNCVITFGSRSPNMKHTPKCPRPYLDNSIKLAETNKRTENKIRLYQYTKCTVCDNLYAFIEDYYEHIDKDHCSDGPYICKCAKEFGNIEEFRQHMYISCYVNYYCDVCYNSFETVNEFRTHCESEHDKETDFTFIEIHQDYKLADSSEIIASRGKRRRTAEDNSQSDQRLDEEADPGEPTPKRFAPDDSAAPKTSTPKNFCDICDRTFNNSYNLKKHMETHKKEQASRDSIINGWKNEPSTCETCGKMFSTYYNMVRHYKMAHMESGKQITCVLCPEKFRISTELKDHLALVHGSSNICQECGKKFNSIAELDQHRSVHLNIKVYRDSKTDSYRTGAKSKYSCEQCDALFDNEEELARHSAIHFVSIEQNGSSQDTRDTKYTCLECNRHYVSYKGLWLHNRRHHPNKKLYQQPIKCEHCGKILATNAAYQAHRQMHERAMNRAREEDEQRQRPREKEGEDDDYFTCKNCFKVFTTKSNLKAHLRTHGIHVSPSRPYTKSGKYTKTFWCDVCHQACHGFVELQRHKQEHATEENDCDVVDVKPKMIHCNICPGIFITELAYSRHKLKHERRGQTKKNFVSCKHCKLPFANAEILAKHVAKEHGERVGNGNEKRSGDLFRCHLCNKSFETSGALCSHQGWHKRTHHQLKSDRRSGGDYKRDESNRDIDNSPQPSTSRSLYEETHDCNTCGMSFANDTKLQIHILEAHRNVNTTVISTKCRICNVEFHSRESFKHHQRIHKANAAAFKCKYCPRTFGRSESVNAHINQTHPEYNDGKYKCHQCNRYFEKQNALTVHLKVHDRQKLTGTTEKEAKPKTYTCSICQASFEFTKDFRNHIITAHPF